MKEQLMKKRYDRYLLDVNKLGEEIKRKNQEKKTKEELDSVNKMQNYQKNVVHQEMELLDKIVKQSGLHMEETLRRQRRKKAFFYNQMQQKFGTYWSNKVEDLSKAKHNKHPGRKKL